jgi:hypothetical protein
LLLLFHYSFLLSSSTPPYFLQLHQLFRLHITYQ